MTPEQERAIRERDGLWERTDYGNLTRSVLIVSPDSHEGYAILDRRLLLAAIDSLRSEYDEMREALQTLADQSSGKVGSTARADCMAAYARAALKP